MHIPEYLKSRENKLLSIALVVLAAAWLWALWPRQSGLTVTFLSVGQGDATVVRTPSGRTVLIDAGPGGDYDAGSKVVVPFLRRQGINTIDSFILTHPHEDHVGGAMSVFRNVNVGCMLDSGIVHPSGTYQELLEMVDERHIPYQRLVRGQIIDLQDGVTMEVLSPPGGSSPPDGDKLVNNNSVVLMLRYKDTSFLLCGDAEKDAEEEILSTDADLSCQVIKVGHHGSPQATTYAWIAASQPEIAVISVGWHNQFGHPSSKTLQRIEETGVQVYRTDKNGGVTVFSDGNSLKIETGRTPSGR